MLKIYVFCLVPRFYDAENGVRLNCPDRGKCAMYINYFGVGYPATPIRLHILISSTCCSFSLVSVTPGVYFKQKLCPY